MSNFTSANPSINQGLSDWATYGGLSRLFAGSPAATTAATASCGGVSCARFYKPFIMPAPGTGLKGGILTLADFHSNGAGQHFICLEYLLGTLTLSGNAFSAGVTMPTKMIRGANVQTASSLAFLVVTTAGTATTPTITITYTNQDGTTGQTIAPVLPTTPLVNTAFYLNPSMLANGDSGIRAVTGMSSSVTTGAMVAAVYGCLVLNPVIVSTPNQPLGSPEPLLSPTTPLYLCESGEAINAYRTDQAAATDFAAALAFCPETT